MGLLTSVAKPFLGGGAKRAAGISRRESRNIALMKAIQQRRTFIRTARQAQADALTQGVGLGLESSAAQGGRASLQTQTEVGLADFEEISRRQNRISRFNELAILRSEEDARVLEGLGGIESIMSFGFQQPVNTTQSVTTPKEPGSNG